MTNSTSTLIHDAPTRRPRSVVGPLAAAAGVAAIVIGGVAITAAKHDTPTGGPAQEQVTASPIDVERALYAVMDARGDEGFFYIRVTAAEHSATLWGSPSPAARTQLEQAVTSLGYDLAVEAVPPPESWSAEDSEALSAAAEEVRTRLAAGAAGLATLRIEVPLRTLVVWRTDADPALDASLQRIADAHGIRLLLRTAPASEAAAAAIETELRADPSLNGASFQVVGASATSSGVVVVVTGDLALARKALEGRDDIFAVQLQTGTPAPGTAG